MFKIAIVGAGIIGKSHSDAILSNPDCELVAVCDVNEEKAKEILIKDEIQIIIALGDGSGAACAWGCDLTYDYVKINGDYRT